jgi:rhodanese-related sulfurtransferase
MQKTFRKSKFLFLATIAFLIAGLQYITREDSSISCSPFCRTFLESNSRVFAASSDSQKTAVAITTSTTANASPIKAVVHPEVPRIPANEVREMLAKKADFILVDTNPADYFEMWHIPSAVNLPYVTLINTPEKREAMLGMLPKDKLIVIYCLCEEGANSSEVALMLRSMGYRGDRVKVLEGGLIQWDAKKYPMIKTEIPE